MRQDEGQREQESIPQELMREDRGIGRDIALVLAGITIGAGLALLLTPRRGDEVRDAISRGYRKTLENLTERAQSLTEDLRERAQSLTGELRERAPNLLRFTRQREERYRKG
jgi:gas vesicle protein